MAKIIQYTSVDETDTNSLEFSNFGEHIRFFITDIDLGFKRVDISIEDVRDMIHELQKMIEENG